MAVSKPAIIDRRKTALGYPSRTSMKGNRRPVKGIKYIAWHYTATTNSFITTHEKYWRNNLGWGLGGYTFYISRDGTIYQNYDFVVRTNGVAGHNTHALSISVEASSKSNYTDAQIKSREHLTLWLMQELNIPASRVLGHKEFSGQSTSCPGYSKADMNRFRSNLAKKAGKTYKPSSTSSTSVAGAYKVKDEKAIFKLSENIKYRDKPSAQAKHLGTLKKGDEVEYFAVYEGSGYRWLAFKKDDKTCYLPYRPLKSNQAWGTFHALPNIPKEKQLQKYVGNDGWRELEVGSVATIRKGAKRWLNANMKQMELMQKDFSGVQDHIDAKRDVKIGYSNWAYHFKTLKTWILEQDLVEPRESKKQGSQAIYRVQVGAYADKTNADKVAKELKGKGYQVVVVEEE